MTAWTELCYNDPRDVADMRMNHLSKLAVSTTRHLWADHGREPVAEQIPLPRLVELHHALHTADELRSHHVCSVVPDCRKRPSSPRTLTP